MREKGDVDQVIKADGFLFTSPFLSFLPPSLPLFPSPYHALRPSATPRCSSFSGADTAEGRLQERRWWWWCGGLVSGEGWEGGEGGEGRRSHLGGSQQVGDGEAGEEGASLGASKMEGKTFR